MGERVFAGMGVVVLPWGTTTALGEEKDYNSSALKNNAIVDISRMRTLLVDDRLASLVG